MSDRANHPAAGLRGPDNFAIAVVGECMIEIVRRRNGECGFGYAGDTLNAALYMARLGMRPSYVTAIGVDPFSDAMIDFWRREGIGTELVVRRPDRLPGLYVVSVDAKGEHQFHYWRNDSKLGLIEVLARTRRDGNQIIFDTNYRARLWPDPALARTAYEAALAVSDLVFTSLDDEAPVFGDGSEADLVARHRRAGVVETVVRNRRPGSRVIIPGADIDIAVDAPPVAAVVDTTAAGDSFAAAYVAARARGIDPRAAALIGHRLAAAKCASPGAILPRDRMPTDLLPVRTSSAPTEGPSHDLNP